MVLVSQNLFAIDTPFGFGNDGHVEIGISEFAVWHQDEQGVPDPDVKKMGFFITTSDSQTLLEYDLSQARLAASVAQACACNRGAVHLYLVPRAVEA